MGRSGGGGGGFSGGGRSGGGGFGGGGRIGGGGFSRGGGSFGGGFSGRSGGSFGGSSNRSSGSFGGSSNRSSGSYHSGPSFTGAPVPPVRPRPVYYSSGRVYRGSGTGRGMGCGVTAIIFLVIIFIIIFIMASSIGGIFGGGSSTNSSGVTASTWQREALPAGSVNETGYYTDELNWIGNNTKLERGMKDFYHKTGVQPYLYITDTINGSHYPTLDDLEAFAVEQYNQLFTDQAHLLLVFFEYDSNPYMVYCLTGSQAKQVIDDEAYNILLDYIDRYYYYNGLTDEEFFSNAFRDASERIMTVTTSPWIYVLVIAGVVLLVVIGFVWWRHAKKQKNLEAQQTEDMLNTPLDKFGDKEAEELGKKYDDDPNNDPKT